ncbi:MAG: SdpI family protein [Caldilineaceae bacterium]
MTQEKTVNLTIVWRICALVLVIMFGMSLWAWFQLPADAAVPVHWNAAGTVDRYGGKIEGLLLLPLVTTGVVGLFSLIRYIDPLRANIQKSGQAYRATILGVVLFMALLHTIAILSALGYPLNMGSIIAPALALLFIVLGNYMGKIRRNYMFGVRTPWTLASDLAWNKTHRFTGRLFVIAGLLILLAGFWGPAWAFYTMMATVLGSVVLAMLYSYFVWKHDPTVHPIEDAK